MSLDRNAYDARVDALIQEHIPELRVYLRNHAQRFFELFSTVAELCGELPAPRILEVGTSPFSALYRDMFPRAKLTTVDRPKRMDGTSAREAKRRYGSVRHHNVDLNRKPLPVIGQFDVIVFSEILEHLTVAPEQVISELIANLAPEGSLYLTTPNVFSYRHLMQTRHRQNPRPELFRRGEDVHATYHVREYAMTEIVAAVHAAGGRTVSGTYSDCWEREPDVAAKLARFPYLQGNLVIIAKRAESTDSQTQIEFPMFGAFDPLRQDLHEV